jgi:hypothetical protein
LGCREENMVSPEWEEWSGREMGRGEKIWEME